MTPTTSARASQRQTAIMGLTLAGWGCHRLFSCHPLTNVQIVEEGQCVEMALSIVEASWKIASIVDKIGDNHDDSYKCCCHSSSQDRPNEHLDLISKFNKVMRGVKLPAMVRVRLSDVHILESCHTSAKDRLTSRWCMFIYQKRIGYWLTHASIWNKPKWHCDFDL